MIIYTSISRDQNSHQYGSAVLLSHVFAKYDLFKPTIFIQNLAYDDFCINLTKFFINFSRQKHQIERARSRSSPK